MYTKGGTFIFDIETIPVRLDALAEKEQEYLLKFSDNTPEARGVVQKQMAGWAPTTKIIAIGVYCLETDTGAVYFQAGDSQIDFVEEGIRYVSGDESYILGQFWRAMRHTKQFVTFNGRKFDCPILMLRSAMLGVRPSIDLMPYRYQTARHVDLLEQLTFYGTTRKFSLEMYCTSFGIPSPKSQMTGHDLPSYFESARYEEIARYCLGDVQATAQLFLRWREYVSFPSRR